MKCHTKEREYACPWCGSLYANRTKLIDHIQRLTTSSENHCYQCTHCLKTFPNERLLKDHMWHHSTYYKNNVFKCFFFVFHNLLFNLTIYNGIKAYGDHKLNVYYIYIIYLRTSRKR